MRNIIGHDSGQILFATQQPVYYKFDPAPDLSTLEVDESTYLKVYQTVGQLKFRVDSNNKIVPIPDKPSEFHIWDWTQLTWKQDAALAEKSVRDKRAMLLNNTVDKINAVRWAAMTEDERTSWDEYRTALLDITLQEGFPFNVIWPAVPQ